ncbi:MAG: hypothetical protein K2O08_03935 [Clostridia bacterium]|nr:hypothetical protein [Clostridia bacterium]
MARLFFDKPKGIILTNGVKCDSNSIEVGKNFCLQYIPFDPSLREISFACENKIISNKDFCFIKHGKDYIVKFCPDKKPICDEEETYIQHFAHCNNYPSHCLSCKCKEGHRIVVETENEIHFISAPCRVENCSFKTAPLEKGQLLTVFARLDNGKTYVCALHYLDDYTPLLSLYCDEVYCEEDGLTVCDYMDDTMARKCVRKISFCSDGFAEISRHFEYGCNHCYTDELIPYVFLESLNCGDDECARGCVSYNLKDFDFHTFFGEFIEICDCLEYKPYVVTLVYSSENVFYTRSYKFGVSGGKIVKVNLL